MLVRLVIGIAVGGLLGYSARRLVGCSSGSCPITSRAWISTLVGMLIGAALSQAM